MYTIQHTWIDFTNNEMINTCFAFIKNRKEVLVPWNILINLRDNSVSDLARLVARESSVTRLESSWVLWGSPCFNHLQ